MIRRLVASALISLSTGIAISFSGAAFAATSLPGFNGAPWGANYAPVYQALASKFNFLRKSDRTPAGEDLLIFAGSYAGYKEVKITAKLIDGRFCEAMAIVEVPPGKTMFSIWLDLWQKLDGVYGKNTDFSINWDESVPAPERDSDSSEFFQNFEPGKAVSTPVWEFSDGNHITLQPVANIGEESKSVWVIYRSPLNDASKDTSGM